MNDFLEQMRAASRARVAQAKSILPEGELRFRAGIVAHPPVLKLHPQGFDVIAEIKRRSPAAGSLTQSDATFDVAAQARAYGEAGAAAVSVLTEPDHFGGSLDDLRVAAEALRPLRVPVMRKDFIVDSYQISEACLHGASGVLLILALLEDAQIPHIFYTAASLEMFVVLEIFDIEELKRKPVIFDNYARKQDILLGVNSRDLRTLEVDSERLKEYAPHMPAGVPAVAESGIWDGEGAAWTAVLGYRLALVGSALMRAPAPGKLLRDMLRHGRLAAQIRARMIAEARSMSRGLH